jgi:hypothetical protein
MFQSIGGAAMFRIAISAGLLAVIFSGFPGDGQAFWCGGGLLTAGGHTGEGLVEGGPPTSKEAGAKTTEKTRVVHGSKARRASSLGTHRENSGKVERWVYNCGEHDFVYALTFEGGVLTKEETMGYGKGRSQCQGRR